MDLPEELVKEWNNLHVVADLGEGCPISIPKSYFRDVSSSPTINHSLRLLHRVYTGLCSGGVPGTDVVQFLVSKMRVAPLQTQTVPRVVFLSAFLLFELIVSVFESLQPILPHLRIQCYTDSQVTLYWICGTNREWKPFVRNRVNEIRRNVHPSAWNHCP